MLNHTEPLSFAAGRLYTTLSVADAAAATAFIAQAEPRAVRLRYEQAITDAAVAVTRASSGLTDQPLVQLLGRINAELAVYTGLIEIARTNNREGNPVGSSYLSEASGLMQSTILPDAQQLYKATSERVDSETTASTQIPAPVILVVAATVVFGAFSHRWLARRTRRRINPGLVVGALGILVMVVWVGTALAISTTASRSAKDTAAESLKTVTNVAITAQQARADETLSLIRRGDEEIRKQSFYQRIDAMHQQLDRVHGPPGRRRQARPAGRRPAAGPLAAGQRPDQLLHLGRQLPGRHPGRAGQRRGRLHARVRQARRRAGQGHGPKPHPPAQRRPQRAQRAVRAPRSAAWCSAWAPPSRSRSACGPG